MSRCKREGNSDLICASYKTMSNRSTRLLLLEIVVEAFLKEHDESVRDSFGEGYFCECGVCEKGREAMRLKHTR